MEKCQLVIVDDEPVILGLLESIFSDDDEFVVTACPDGKSAMTAIERGVDVLLTDKNLPDIGGLELLRYAKRLHSHVEGIIITGYASLDTVLAAIELDAFDYIVKPPKDIFEVKRKVSQAFAKICMHKENQQLMGSLQDQNSALEITLTEMRDLQAELIQSEKLAGIGTLAAGVAHEIGSPLFGVMGLAEAIIAEDDADLINKYAKDIVKYSKAIREIVQQLSGYSRTAEHEYLTQVDLGAVISDAVQLLDRAVPNMPAVVDLKAGEGLQIQARPNELQQVFVNLLRNALDAVVERHGTDGEGRIQVEVLRENGAIHTWVRDNGPGITEEGQKVIFDPFFTTKSPGKGTGLGLNIVYRIVTKYNGSIAVESEFGVGTTFHLCFPVEG